jgi:hypothetical protein
MKRKRCFHAMKTYREWKYSSTILDLGSRWKLRAPAALPAVDPRAVLGAMEERKRNILHLPGIEPQQSSS